MTAADASHPLRTEPVFVHGSLAEREVQCDVFGRILVGARAALSGYTVDYVEAADPRRPDDSRPTTRPVLRATGNDRDKVVGQLVLLSPDELDAADEWEGPLLRRTQVSLDGAAAWVYLA